MKEPNPSASIGEQLTDRPREMRELSQDLLPAEFPHPLSPPTRRLLNNFVLTRQVPWHTTCGDAFLRLDNWSASTILFGAIQAIHSLRHEYDVETAAEQILRDLVELLNLLPKHSYIVIRKDK